MDAKSLLLFVILPLCLLAGLVAVGLGTWKDIRQTDLEIKREPEVGVSGRARPGTPRPISPLSVTEKPRTVRPSDLDREGEAHEGREEWNEALACYQESLKLADRPETRAKVKAVQAVQMARRLEREGNWAEALKAYKLALPDSGNKPFVEQRIQYCENIEPYTKAYAEANAAADVSEWRKALDAFARAGQFAANAGIETDAAARITMIRGTIQEKERARAREELLKKKMVCLLEALHKQGKHRALLLACDYYAASPEHAKHAAAIQAARQAAEKAVAADRAQHPADKAGRTFAFLTKKDGTVFRGKVLQQDERVYRFQIMEPGRRATTMIAARAVASVEQREVSGEKLMNERAQEVLAEAFALIEKGDTLEAAERIGLLCLDYVDTAFFKDEAKQKIVFAAKASGLTPLIGSTLAEARRRIVPLAEVRAASALGMALAQLPPGFGKAFLVPTTDRDQYGNAVVSRNGTKADGVTGWPYEIWLDEPRMEFVLVPAGEFMMGSLMSPEQVARQYRPRGRYMDLLTREHPRHRVRIGKSFYLAKYELTDGQWSTAGGARARVRPGEEYDPRRPARYLTWDGCQAFCANLSRIAAGAELRLPTEAEWEHACRAETTSIFSFGDDARLLDDYGWHRGNAQSAAQPVGLKRPNPWGLHDMHGNVWEWCQDWLGPYQPGEKMDPMGAPQGSVRVIRGASYLAPVWYCRCAFRSAFQPRRRVRDVGLRIALSLL